MNLPDLRITVLPNSGDVRGASFLPSTRWAAFLGEVRDMHMATLLPGHARGNHYHAERREVLVVLFEDVWLLKWDRGEGSAAAERSFPGAGAALVEIDPLAAHAVSNTGRKPLWIVSLCSRAYDPQAPDAYPRQLTS